MQPHAPQHERKRKDRLAAVSPKSDEYFIRRLRAQQWSCASCANQTDPSRRDHPRGVGALPGVAWRIDSKMPEVGICTGLELNSLIAVCDNPVPKRTWHRFRHWLTMTGNQCGSRPLVPDRPIGGSRSRQCFCWLRCSPSSYRLPSINWVASLH